MELITDPPTLLSLCRSCSSIRWEAETYLYASIDAQPIRRHLRFLSTITTNPRLASLVRSYRNNDFYYYANSRFGWLLRQGLRAMTKLRDLDLTDDFPGENKDKMEFLERCGFQLESFAWRSEWISDWESMVSFLRQQHSLDRLVLTAVKSGTWLPSDTCQNLSSLSGPLFALEAFLPGRKITTLHWTSGSRDKFTPEVVSLLAESFNQLRFLSVGGSFARPHLSGIVDHLCLVEVLELFFLSTSELPLLPKLPRLNNIIISSGPYWHLPGVRIENHPDVVNRIFTTCAAIRRVDIQYKRMDGYDFFVFWLDNVRQDELEWKRQAWRELIY